MLKLDPEDSDKEDGDAIDSSSPTKAAQSQDVSVVVAGGGVGVGIPAGGGGEAINTVTPTMMTTRHQNSTYNVAGSGGGGGANRDTDNMILNVETGQLEYANNVSTNKSSVANENPIHNSVKKVSARFLFILRYTYILKFLGAFPVEIKIPSSFT